MKPVRLSPGVGDDRPSASLYYGQDVRKTLALLGEGSVDTVCTSPPYWGLRDYGTEGQIGQEETPEEFAEALVETFSLVKRVLRKDGTLWVNLGDSYAGGGRAGNDPEYHKKHTMFGKTLDPSEFGRFGRPQPIPEGLKAKDLVGVPWRVALALQKDGWYLRSAMPWVKMTCMPESCRDRPSVSHEYVFLFAHPESRGSYYYDLDAVKLSTRNRRTGDTMMESLGYMQDEITALQEGGGLLHGPDGTPLTFQVNPKPYRGAHFAVWPPDLVRPMVKAGSPRGGTVLDPFSGSATTGLVALQEGRHYIGIDNNPEYLELAKARVQNLPAPKSGKGEGDDAVLDMFGVD